MKKSIGILSIALMLVTTSIVGQTMVHGVTLPSTVAKDKTTLTLNGVGTRNKYFINVYVLGLYLPSKESDASKILNANETMGVRLTIISNLVTREKMADAMRDGFELSLDGNTAPFKNEIDKAVEVFESGEINVGDIFDIWYSSTKGKMQASKNGKAVNFDIEGMDFKKAVFGIWLGEEPVDDNLKDGVLGL